MDAAVVDEILVPFDVLYDQSLVDDRKKLLAVSAGARALIVRNRTQVDAELLDNAPDLEVVGRLGVGLDNIDLEHCERRGVRVFPATGANDVAVAEYTIMAALMLLRGVWQSGDSVSAGRWPRTDCMGREATGKHFGLIGFGSIARQVANRAMALGMRVSACDPYLPQDDRAWDGIDSTSLDAIATECDVISIHVPLTDETRYLVDAAFIRRMRSGGILINTARGGVVDESALIAALRNGEVGGAALDVFETEPVDAETGKPFLAVSNLLLTPHIAGISEESNARVSRLTAEQVAAHLQR